MNDQRHGFFNMSFSLAFAKPFRLPCLSQSNSLNTMHQPIEKFDTARIRFIGWSLDNESRRFDPSAWLYLNDEVIPVSLIKVTHGFKQVWVWLQAPNMPTSKFKVQLAAHEKPVFFAWAKRFDKQQKSLTSRFQHWLKASSQS